MKWMNEWASGVIAWPVTPVVMTLPAFPPAAFHFSYSSPPLSAKRKAACRYIEFLLFLELDFLQAQLSSCHSHSTLSGTDVNCLGTRASFPSRSPRPAIGCWSRVYQEISPGLNLHYQPAWSNLFLADCHKNVWRMTSGTCQWLEIWRFCLWITGGEEKNTSLSWADF